MLLQDLWMLCLVMIKYSLGFFACTGISAHMNSSTSAGVCGLLVLARMSRMCACSSSLFWNFITAV